ncbi:Aste57867_10771 [Aphanomyces stellatus]|uniref:Aste57867_10771 protein n=1 Tax=Aphanomyces stellatus TaxID=120398 RepID=A0A485KRZ1_9STRA|nr:hypothetical protein As57867_010731 [Aphanomyces stellatus]VFT87641.1 Aste57867_10771 [Aphanomyces stellatus]
MSDTNKSRVSFLLNPSLLPLPCHTPTSSFRIANLLNQPLPSTWKIESGVQDLISVEFHESGGLASIRSQCHVEGCTTAAVSKGLCVRHGGGTRCTEPGCNKRTKRFRRCYLHGGFIYCNVESCKSKAKRFGRCWAHGGGSQCANDGCEKLAVKGGLCWTHGGGCRCRVLDCGRRAYKRFEFYCEGHFMLRAGGHGACINDANVLFEC